MSAAADPVTLASWTFGAPVVWCAVAAAAYDGGRRRRRARFGPGTPPAGQVAAFWCGLVVIVAALASPLDAAAEQLFAAHMTQHLLLALVAPLLMVVAAPGRVLTWTLPRATRHVVVRAGHRLGVATGLTRGATVTGFAAVGAHVLTLAAWHVPVAYDLALRNDLVHIVEHVTLFATGLALWWVVLGIRWQRRSGLAVVYLFLAGLPMGALAALLTLAPHALYAGHAATTARWGLTPIEDQQLAGAIMWVPGGFVYLGASAVCVVRWLGSGPARGERRLVWDA